MTHQERVAARFPPDTIEQQVALYHDHIEDNLGEWPYELKRHLLILTRVKGEKYVDYILRVAASNDLVAIKVKLADLTDNIERCDGQHDGNVSPSLKQRYVNAKVILLRVLQMRSQEGT